MHPSLQQDIPEFLFDSIVYCDSLTYRRNLKSSFALTKNLKFYEFRRKQLLHCIDLSETCFSKLRQQIEKYSGPKSKWSTDPELFGRSASSGQKTETAQQSLSKFDIRFGKYIYKMLSTSKLYLLLTCWDKLVVVRCTDETSPLGLCFVTEFENVADFKIVTCSTMKYQAALDIRFIDEKSICTDFEEEEYFEDSTSNLLDQHLQKTECKKLFERVQRTKAELQHHKEITNKLFHSIKNEQTFGNNFIRSTSLDEKSMLTRCGDVWFRITSSEKLVIGVPLVNNCAPPNLTILKNLHPVLCVRSLGSTAVNSKNTPISMHLEYRIYQLQQTFENLDTLETFFQSEDDHFQHSTWAQTESRILPSSFVVLLIKLNLSQVIFISEEQPLFVHFEVEKEYQTDELETLVFEHHLFVKTLDFQKLLQDRKKYEIRFKDETLHQDFLAISMAGFETQLQIDFKTYGDLRKFDNLLEMKFDFEIVYRRLNDNLNENTLENEFDKSSNENKGLSCTLFYNKNPSSVWFGSLVVRNTEIECDSDTHRISLVFYNKNQDNAILMFNLLFTELVTLKCNVVDIKTGKQCQNSMTQITNFEKALRQELEATLDLAKNQYDAETLFQKFKSLILLQYKSDTLSSSLHNQ